MSPDIKVPMSSPDLTDAEREAVAAVLRTPNLSMGGEIQGFEAAFCEYTGRKHAIGVNSGTAGLHLCVRAAGIGDGDLVITTPFSFVASANVLLFERAVPVFVDVDPTTGNIDPQSVREAAIEICQWRRSSARPGCRARAYHGKGQLKAILPVDVFGQPADLDPIRKIAKQHGLNDDRRFLRGAGGGIQGAQSRHAGRSSACSPFTPTSRSPPAKAV